MLGRRQLRAKAMQTLYAYYRGNNNPRANEKNMMNGIYEIQDLYHLMLDLLLAVKYEAEASIQKGLEKNLPSAEEANPNYRFVNNPIFKVLESNPELNEFREKHGELSWAIESSYPSKIFKALKNSEEYKKYQSAENVSFNQHRRFIIRLYKDFIAPSEEIYSYIEDKKINWAEDLAIANTMVLNTIQSFIAKSDENTKLLKLLLDESHLEFTKELVRESIAHEVELNEIIKNNASNWEIDRIALIDKILMQMALVEFLYFPNIPPKVTINEYIEIAKDFSTENSAIFINGILDKSLKDLTEKDKVRKSARGLM